MSNQLILVDASAGKCISAMLFDTAKEEALAVSSLVNRIASEDENKCAVAAVGTIRGLLKEIEDSRKAVKAPLLDLGKRIDSKAREMSTDLEAEVERIAKPMRDYQNVLETQRRAAEALAREQERKLEAERQAKLAEASREQQRLIDEERARVAAEVKSATPGVSVEQIVEASNNRLAELVTAQSIEHIDQINAEHAAKVAEMREAQVAAAPVAPKGQSVKKDWKIEVVDPWLLACAHRNCVKLEPLLSQIKGLLNAGVKVAGVKAELVTNVSVRANAGAMLIEA